MNSLTSRLIAAFVAIIVLVILIVSFTLLVLLRNNPLVERQDLARLAAASLAITRKDLLGVDQSPDRLAARLGQVASTYNVRIIVTDLAGEVSLDSASPPGPALNLRRFRAARSDALFPEALVGQARDNLGRPWLYLARAFGAGRMLVIASQPTRFSAVLFFSEYLLWPLAEAAGVAAILAAILAVVIARSIAHPLQEMSVVAQGIARGDYALSAPVRGPDEVRSLGQSLNQMARQVQTTQQAQRDFLANVSHELRTPLTSIQGFAQALLEGAAVTPAAIQRAAGIIFGEAERMGRLVEGLLDLARLDAGLRALNVSKLDLRAILAGIADKFSLRASEAGQTLQVDLPPSLPQLIGDPDRLAQVFSNLLDNAIKHTPSGGRVTLAAIASPTTAEISVADTGSGIPADDLSRIFERFYQVDKSRARSSGLGLGLAISKEIVEAHGGRLRASSQVGQGSRFVVQLPLPQSTDATLARKR